MDRGWLAGVGLAAGLLLGAPAVAATPGPVRLEILRRFVAPSGFVWWTVELTNVGSAPVTIVDMTLSADEHRFPANPSGRTLPVFLRQGGRLSPGESVSGPVRFDGIEAASRPEGLLRVRYRDETGMLHAVEVLLRVGAAPEASP